MGESVYGRPLTIETSSFESAPAEHETAAPLGRHLEGCRIGFDLGASDRKCAAVIDGEVVFSEEVAWDPQRPARSAISLRRHPRFAAARRRPTAARRRHRRQFRRRLREQRSPRGVAVSRRAAHLFDSRVRRLFFELQEAWGGVPFEVVNDGEVTALAGSMALNDNAVLGIAMGSSLAAGYVTPAGQHHTLAQRTGLRPVDYRADAPVDEWSGDRGVGVQYFSQQAVGRLLAPAGIDLPARHAAARANLSEVQNLMAAGDERARKIYETIGVYFGYTIATYADFYEFRNLLVLGRVLTGAGRRPDSLHRRAGAARRISRTGRAHPLSYSRRAGEAPRPSHRRRQPARHSKPRGDKMQFHNSDADFFVPDGTSPEAALARTTHLCIAAHQDDIEIMAYHGIAECFGSTGKWFTGVVVTNGAGSPRSWYLRRLHRRGNAEGARAGAAQGRLCGRVRLPDPTRIHQRASEERERDALVDDLQQILSALCARMLSISTTWPTSTIRTSASLLRCIAALRGVRGTVRPKKVYGCEVWRDLDWMPDDDKQVLPASAKPNIAAALVGVFDSQMTGGKRYDLATAGRRVANATYFASHGTDQETALNFAMDLTPLVEDPSLSIAGYVLGFIDNFRNDVELRLRSFN